jgi:hypothetical protein
MTDLIEKREKRYVTSRELAFRYGICVRQIQKMKNSRIIPYVKLGKHCVRFDIEECDKAMKRFEHQASEVFDKKKIKRNRKGFPTTPYGSSEIDFI